MEGLGRTPCTSWEVGRDGIGGRDFRKGASCGAGAMGGQGNGDTVTKAMGDTVTTAMGDQSTA